MNCEQSSARGEIFEHSSIPGAKTETETARMNNHKQQKQGKNICCTVH
jgi:hypothetical protein